MTAAVPFVDLTHSLGPREELLADLAELMDTCSYTNGPHVAAFERAFADYCGSRFAVGVASGLDALRLALLAAGIEPGEELVVPALTFVATWEAVTQAGGVPVPVDVSEDDYTIEVAAAEAALTARTRCLMPVHLYGQMADMAALQGLAARSGLRIVEDACQAHGALRDGVRAGTAGAAGAFSFYPAKNLGAFGDAGALVTDDEELAAAVRALREHGQHAKYEHEREGYTARLDSIQALVLLRKLPLLDGWNEQRRQAAALYTEALEGIGDLRLPRVAHGSDPVWHLYVVRTADPGRLGEFLAGRGVGTARHYPQPPHLAPAYRRLGYRPGTFPVAEALAAEALSLPMFPGISEAQVAAVAAAVADFFHRG